MRRFMLPIFAGLTLAAALTACDAKSPQTAPPPSSAAPAASPTQQGDDKVACATAKAAQTAAVNDILLASLTIADEASTAAEVTEAAQGLKTAFDKLGQGLNQAADQAGTAALRDALRTYASGAKTVVANIDAAGADRSKLEAAADVPATEAAEDTVMTTCA